jgi:hypothetical protein
MAEAILRKRRLKDMTQMDTLLHFTLAESVELDFWQEENLPWSGEDKPVRGIVFTSQEKVEGHHFRHGVARRVRRYHGRERIVYAMLYEVVYNDRAFWTTGATGVRTIRTTNDQGVEEERIYSVESASEWLYFVNVQRMPMLLAGRDDLWAVVFNEDGPRGFLQKLRREDDGGIWKGYSKFFLYKALLLTDQEKTEWAEGRRSIQAH